LGELRLSVLEDSVESDLDLVAARPGRRTAPPCEQHPFRERLQAALMKALFQAGRQAEALEQYTHYRERCVDELGVDPGPAVEALQASILAGGADLAPAADPLGRLSRTDDPTSTLPRSATRLVDATASSLNSARC
jgi:DNA-binding SARP family transcriptional activator